MMKQSAVSTQYSGISIVGDHNSRSYSALSSRAESDKRSAVGRSRGTLSFVAATGLFGTEC
jgi:hypothetical protein